MDDETKALLQIRIVRVVYRAELHRSLVNGEPSADGYLVAVRDRGLALLKDTELALDGDATANVVAAIRDARHELAV